MRLDLREIIQVPGGNVPFSFALDLSGLDFYGAKPIAHPILVEGQVRNRPCRTRATATTLWRMPIWTRF